MHLHVVNVVSVPSHQSRAGLGARWQNAAVFHRPGRDWSRGLGLHDTSVRDFGKG